MTEATRQVYWNVAHVWVMYALFVPTVIIGAYGVLRRVQRWRRGRPLARFDQPMRRLRLVLDRALAQRRIVVRHKLIAWGFIVLTIATTLVALDADFGTHILHGSFYLWFQSLTVDVFGVAVVVGIAMAAWQLVWERPSSAALRRARTPAATLLLAIVVICATGFLLEGWRIAATSDPWAAWSPVGNLVAMVSRPLMSVAAMRAAHRVTWWFHLTIVFAFLAWLPYTKLLHVVAAPLNIYTANLEPIGASLRAVDFESEQPLGVRTASDFTWKDLLDLDACTECGRCTDACPAHAAGKSLSPRDLILELRDTDSTTQPVWECTTCGACVEACPVFVEQMPKIVDLRRHRVMEEADFPETMQEAIVSLEKRGHPFAGTQATRLDWAEGLDVKHISEAADAEVLLWVGCGGALIERNQRVIRAIALLLQRAGVRFAILGREEKCSGDPARRIGNEFLFEKLARENVASLDRYRVRKIVTPCPHCFNTFRNEYPRYGGRYEVYHHSEFLAELVRQGKLASDSGSVTFHDPCYLGRQNGVYDAPRELLGKVIEMPRNRNQSFCCGGGGGMSFIEEPPGERVNQQRATEALASGADVLAVACPFCMTMMQDGIDARKGSREMRVLDIAEVLLAANEG